MKILFLGSVFATENEEEVLENSKVAVEYSANNFQKKMIEKKISKEEEENNE